MENGFRKVSNRGRDIFYIFKGELDVQDYVVLFCRDVHQHAGAENRGCGKGKRHTGADQYLQYTEFDLQFANYQVMLLGP